MGIIVVAVIIIIYRWGTWSAERLINLSKVTQLWDMSFFVETFFAFYHHGSSLPVFKKIINMTIQVYILHDKYRKMYLLWKL